jgi:gamma-glutamyltranspeptidase / glutathione hydrolase
MARFRHSQVANTLSLETSLYDLVGSKLAAMGHTVRAVSGEDVGGVQVLMFVPEPGARPSDDIGSAKHVAGYYRSGSDFRKDGEAVGW